MKRLLLLAMLVLLVAPVVATTYDFQEYNSTPTVGIGTGMSWVRSGNGGNSYISITATTGANGYLFGGSPTTYVAGTVLSNSLYPNGIIVLYDNTMTQLYAVSALDTGRYEIIMSGGKAYVYKNGILTATSGALAQNPTYEVIGGGSGTTGTVTWDDIIVGTSDDRTVLGMPEPDIYMVEKDMVTPAASGFYYYANATRISSNTFTTTFSRSNTSDYHTTNESVYLINRDTGTVYETQYTGNASHGTLTWDIGSSLIAAGAPYGFYQIKTGSTVSAIILPYIADGAEIYFNSDEYSSGETANITWNINPAYWDTTVYTYSWKIVDVYGTEIESGGISSYIGSDSYAWADDDAQGVYYLELIATEISTGDDILMNYDYATLSAYYGFDGYVNAAQTALPIEAANVSYAQGDILSTDSSGFDGNYSASGFLTGLPIWANISADGYETQNFTFTVTNGHNIRRNITLNETTPSYTGIAIGGVCRDGVFTDPNTITNGYGRPISYPDCFLLNTTHGESYTTAGNNAGGYLFDESGSVFLTAGRVYDLWCERSGYGNSPNYTVVVYT